MADYCGPVTVSTGKIGVYASSRRRGAGWGRVTPVSTGKEGGPMALLGLDAKQVAVMNSLERWNYFTSYASRLEDAPPKGPHYAIRIGSHTIYANETDELREKFEIMCRKLRRKLGLRINK